MALEPKSTESSCNSSEYIPKENGGCDTDFTCVCVHSNDDDDDDDDDGGGGGMI